MTDPAIFILLGLFAITVLPATVWLIGIGLWLSRIPHPKRVSTSPKPDTPFVSAIVAAKNEADSIQDCIQSLLESEWPRPSSEFIIVDDHSTDHTAALIRGAAHLDTRVRFLSAPDDPENFGPKKRALTAALKVASGEFVLFTDADCEVPQTWLNSLMREFDDPRVGAVFGASLPPYSASKRLHYFERLMVNVTMASAAGWGVPASACGHSIAYRRSALDQIGGFAHPTLPSGDDDLTIQAIHRAGWQVRFAHVPESLVKDRRDSSWAQRLSAASRHQSTVRFYPTPWRVLYAASVLATILCLVLPIAACFSKQFATLALLSIPAKVSLDAAAVLLFSRQLRLGLSVGDSFLAALTLPLIAVLRVAALMMPTYRWKSNRYAKREAEPLKTNSAATQL